MIRGNGMYRKVLAMILMAVSLFCVVGCSEPEAPPEPTSDKFEALCKIIKDFDDNEISDPSDIIYVGVEEDTRCEIYYTCNEFSYNTETEEDELSGLLAITYYKNYNVAKFKYFYVPTEYQIYNYNGVIDCSKFMGYDVDLPNNDGMVTITSEFCVDDSDYTDKLYYAITKHIKVFSKWLKIRNQNLTTLGYVVTDYNGDYA